MKKILIACVLAANLIAGTDIVYNKKLDYGLLEVLCIDGYKYAVVIIGSGHVSMVQMFKKTKRSTLEAPKQPIKCPDTYGRR